MSDQQFRRNEQQTQHWIELQQDQRLSAIAHSTRALAERANLMQDAVNEQIVYAYSLNVTSPCSYIDDLGELANSKVGTTEKLMRRAAYVLKTNKQSAIYRNEDRFDEEVTEVTESYPLYGGQMLRSHTSLIVGDCDSGKTSLLRSLTDDSDFLTFLHLQSLIPSVFGTFHNYRFCNVELMKAKGMDPASLARSADPKTHKYVDSDIAKASITLTKADWRFLMEELDVKQHAAGDITQFTVVEMGGDHLERLQHIHQHSKALDAASSSAEENCAEDQPQCKPWFDNEKIHEICENSLLFLRSPQLRSISYFINGETATGLNGEPDDGPVRIQAAYMNELSRRFKDLHDWCRHLRNLNIYITRLPPSAAEAAPDLAECSTLDTLFKDTTDILGSVVGQDQAEQFEQQYRKATRPLVYQDLKSKIVSLINRTFNTDILSYRILPFNLFKAGTQVVDICSVYYFMRNTLVTSLASNMDTADADMLRDFIRIIKSNRYTKGPDPTSVFCNVWFTPAIIQAWDQSTRLPLSVLLTNWGRLMDKLANIGGCINGSRNIKVLVDNQEVDWSKSETPNNNSYRLPWYPSLFDGLMKAMEDACMTKQDSIDWALVENFINSWTIEKEYEYMLDEEGVVNLGIDLLGMRHTGRYTVHGGSTEVIVNPTSVELRYGNHRTTAAC